MTRATTVVLLFVLGCGSASGQECLHGPELGPMMRARRERAIQLAVRINQAQSIQVGPGAARPYRPLSELRNIPPTPPGFELKFHTDGTSYTFSIKDRVDPCHYAIFSDQDKHIYEANAKVLNGLVLPVTNQ